MSDENITDNLAKWLFWSFVAIFCGLGIYAWISYKCFGGNMAASGQFGDQFGAMNALFTGMAFLGLILTIGLQSRDIRLQREDLKLQTEALQLQIQEFKDQKEEMRKSAEAQITANLLARRKMDMDILKAKIEYAQIRYSKATDPISKTAASNSINTLIKKMEDLVGSELS